MKSKAGSSGRRHSVALACGLISVVVIGVVTVIVLELRHANASTREMYGTSVRGLSLIAELQYQIQETRRNVLCALTTTDPNLQVEFADQTRSADAKVAKMLLEHESVAEGPAATVVAQRLHTNWPAYLKIRDEVLGLILEDSTKEATELDSRVSEPVFIRVRDDLNELKQLHLKDAEARLAQVNAASRRSIVQLIFLLTVALAGIS